MEESSPSPRKIYFRTELGWGCSDDVYNWRMYRNEPIEMTIEKVGFTPKLEMWFTIYFKLNCLWKANDPTPGIVILTVAHWPKLPKTGGYEIT